MASTLRAVEFYSGIGGMHYALKSCGVAVNVVAAIDINTIANEVYAHNFPNTVLLNRNIEGIKLEEFKKFDADIFTMSPPCQPFTRQGNKKASDDPRTKSFLHIMKVLRSLPKPPSYILMENVKGFEVSETREEFIRTLRETNYAFQEFLLSPMQFGVPNSRLRYFLIAVHKPLQFPFKESDSIMEHLSTSLGSSSLSFDPTSSLLIKDNPRLHCPVCNQQSNELLRHSIPSSTETTNSKIQDAKEENPCSTLIDVKCERTSSTEKKRGLESTLPSEKVDEELCHNDMNDCDRMWARIKNIQHFLEDKRDHYEEFSLPENILKKKVLLMDIVQTKCNHSCCFTKGYGHYAEGTGSILQMSFSDVTSSSIFERYKDAREEERIRILAPLGLRYFTPREIANILCFPAEFGFPKNVTTRQRYRLLGNSLNILVVKELMKKVFFDE
ncbi:tRNA (cytosine(38)-C(5))-methyltransferase-like isoform X2 [Dendronephthya gigantea]|uniref:tRNA (cytosine(38)-C(5))-methyltransferase-like isoform X2 n=1 Tax=Dendronephthya gigantea TaxID=151771 RepID=UPI00106BD2E5|nr:tRNA (cytosine(38)-C(5))-methyltransferase-like isoform X2 [Dendronephthya gigantea]